MNMTIFRRHALAICIAAAALAVVVNSSTVSAAPTRAMACGNACNNGQDDCSSGCFCVTINYCEDNDDCAGHPCNEDHGAECGTECECYDLPAGVCEEDLNR